MQPKTIRLSNELRQKLGQLFAYCDGQKTSVQHAMATRVWQALLSPESREELAKPDSQNVRLPEACINALETVHGEDAHKALREEIYHINQAIIEMQTGTGSPVLYFENLPQNKITASGVEMKTGELMFWSIMQSMLTKPEALSTQQLPTIHFHQGFHQDHPDMFSNKVSRGLYCRNPGKPISPTIFLDADEVIDTMMKRSDIMQQFTTREQLVAALKKVKLCVADGVNEQFLITENPRKNTTTCPHTPSFIFHFLENKNLPGALHTLSHEHINLYTAFCEAAESLRAQTSRESIATVRPNTFTLWNDRLVLHDRGNDRGRGENCTRDILTVMALNDIPTPSVTAAAIGGPMGKCRHLENQPDTKTLLQAAKQSGNVWQGLVHERGIDATGRLGEMK